MIRIEFRLKQRAVGAGAKASIELSPQLAARRLLCCLVCAECVRVYVCVREYECVYGSSETHTHSHAAKQIL